MEQFMTYKNYPFVRQGNEIYIGFMCDPYVVQLQIEKEGQQNGMPVSSKITIYQISTAEMWNNPLESVVKNAARDNLYEAMDVAVAWLDKANA